MMEDFRGQGSPADIGTFEFGLTLVFQHVFNGVTYVVALRSGERGWVLISHLPISTANSTTVIQAAINSLTGGRTWKETVCIIGAFTVNRVDDASYTVLDLNQAILALANNVNDYMFVCEGIHDFEILGGIINGNYTNEIEGGGIRIGVAATCYNFLVYGTRIYDAYRYGITISAVSYDGVVEAVTLSGAGDDNIEISDASHDIEVVAVNSYSPRNDLPPASSSCLEIEDSSYNISVLGGRYVDSPAYGITISGEVTACYGISIVGAVIQQIGVGLYALQVIGSAGQICQRINMVNLTVFSDTGGGVWIRDYTTDITIMGGTFYVSSARALRFTNTTWITVQGAITYDDFGSYNIEVNGCSYMDLSVKITRAYNHGIYILDSTEIEIHDSIIRNVSKHTNNTYAGIQINNSTYVKVHDNIIDGGPNGGENRMDYGIEETGTSDYNDFYDNCILNAQTAPSILAIGVNTHIQSNRGYNPRGNIANPYPVAAGSLTDAAAAQAFPTNNTNYTIAHSPKLITIYGGTVTSILVDGVATGLTSGSFRLEPGQVLHVDWTGQPSSQVYAQ